MTLEVRDLDCLTQTEEFQQVLNKILEPEGRKVTVLGPNKQGLKFAVVFTDREVLPGSCDQ